MTFLKGKSTCSQVKAFPEQPKFVCPWGLGSPGSISVYPSISFTNHPFKTPRGITSPREPPESGSLPYSSAGPRAAHALAARHVPCHRAAIPGRCHRRSACPQTQFSVPVFVEHLRVSRVDTDNKEERMQRSLSADSCPAGSREILNNSPAKILELECSRMSTAMCPFTLLECRSQCSSAESGRSVSSSSQLVYNHKWGSSPEVI